MPVIHFVRVGSPGRIGRFAYAIGDALARGRRVVCRTARGLEAGEVLGVATPEGGAAAPADGSLLRPMTVEDELLLERLERDRESAFAACVQRLEQRGLTATLIDVEHLLDGSSLYFYFLGEVTPEVEDLMVELAEVYARKVEFRRFSDALTHGCGPACGTEATSGCHSSCDSCDICSSCRLGSGSGTGR